MARSGGAMRGRVAGQDDSRSPVIEAFHGLVMRRAYTRADRPFLLASGQTSYDYIDLRRAVADGPDLALAARALIEHLEEKGVEYDAIGGMSMGADPFAHAVALLRPARWFSVRKAEKSHGSRRRIEGADLAGTRVVVLEDTASTGGSILSAYDVVAQSGAAVVHACSLLDRGDTTAAAFAARGVGYSSVLTYRDLGIEPIVVDASN